MLERLTAREMEVLRLIAGGLKYSEVADQLVISEKTLGKPHLEHFRQAAGR